MTSILGTILSLAMVAGLLGLLYVIVRFSIVSEIRTKGSRDRLRIPDPEGVAKVVGFSPPSELVDFYRTFALLESTEFYLVDHSKSPAAEWTIGGFNPLTAIDVDEWRKISRAPGIPIADDLDKGVYFVAANGTVRLRSPNVPSWETEVAPSITAFAKFEARDTSKE